MGAALPPLGAQVSAQVVANPVGSAPRIARVLPDVTGLDREFDYLVPSELCDVIEVGDVVRVSLHRRRITGWIVGFPETSDLDPSRLLPIDARLGCGPSAEVIDLARWAAHRWAGRMRPMMVAGSPRRRILRLPSARRTRGVHHVDDEWANVADGDSPVLVQRGPLFDGLRLIRALVGRGPLIVVVPTMTRVRELASHLKRMQLSVAVVPDEWGSAAGGVDVVVGARSAVWARVKDLAGIVVIDEHDDSLQEERAPTWHAREVAIERARRLSIPCVLLSPIPSVSAFALSATTEWERDFSWPVLEIVDRTKDEQWSRSLVSSRLIEVIRDHSTRVVVVHNAKGRSQLLACSSCRLVASCEHCEGPMAALDDGSLSCRRCARGRPPVCAYCGSSTLANLRPGVGRLLEDLLKASGRDKADTCEVTSASSEINQACGLFVGTEAALHRIRQPDVVVFADFDQELFAPRYRATEIAASLVVTAARQVGRGRVLIQTHSPAHPLLKALREESIGEFVRSEASTRDLLGLPPYGSIALIKGVGAREFVDSFVGNMLIDVSTTGDTYLLRCRSLDTLLEAINVRTPPKGAKITVQVDPPRV
jgi:primosomal protein N' (replication factor Y)